MLKNYYIKALEKIKIIYKTFKLKKKDFVTFVGSLSTESLKLKLELYKTYVISGISISLLILSPTLSIVWLLFTNIYLIYLNGFNLRDIREVWAPTFICWYLVFTFCMRNLVNGYILIGENHTYELLRLMLVNDIWFANLCFQTVYLLHILSVKLNIVVCIPILPLFQLPKTSNADNADSEKKESKSRWGAESKPTQGEGDMKVCRALTQKLKERNESMFDKFHKTVKTRDGDRTVVAGETWIPLVGTFTFCTGMPSFAAKHIDPNDKIPSSESSAPK